MLLGSIWPLAPVMLLAMLGEEAGMRAVAIPLIVLWHFLRDAPEDAGGRLSAHRGLRGTFAAWVGCYFAMKRAFAFEWPADVPIGMSVRLKLNLLRFPPAASMPCAGPGSCLSCSWPPGGGARPLFVAAYLAAIFLVVGPTWPTRIPPCAIAFAFPAVLIALIELHRKHGSSAAHPRSRPAVRYLYTTVSSDEHSYQPPCAIAVVARLRAGHIMRLDCRWLAWGEREMGSMALVEPESEPAGLVSRLEERVGGPEGGDPGALAVQGMSLFLYAPQWADVSATEYTRLHQTYRIAPLCKDPFMCVRGSRSPRSATASFAPLIAYCIGSKRRIWSGGSGRGDHVDARGSCVYSAPPRAVRLMTPRWAFCCWARPWPSSRARPGSVILIAWATSAWSFACCWDRSGLWPGHAAGNARRRVRGGRDPTDRLLAFPARLSGRASEEGRLAPVVFCGGFRGLVHLLSRDEAGPSR